MDCANDAFRTFKPNEKSGVKILEFLKVNRTNVARIDRIGEAEKPVYQPNPVSDEDIKAVNDFH